MSATPDHDQLNAVSESESCQTFFKQLVDVVDQVQTGYLVKTAQFSVSYYNCVCTLLLLNRLSSEMISNCKLSASSRCML